MMEPNSPTPLTAKIIESGATREHYCASCCCSITTLYAPTSLALCLGQLAQGLSPVSYTHLTLPTILLV